MASTQGLAPQGFFEHLTEGQRCSACLSEILKGEADRHDLTEMACRTLWICHRQGPAGVSQADIAAELDLSPAHVSALVEDLRARDLLLGERRPPDRRRQFWSLTPSGAEIFLPLADRLNAVLEASTEIKAIVGSFSANANQLRMALQIQSGDSRHHRKTPSAQDKSKLAKRAA